MVEVVCDTSFLVQLSTKNIKNLAFVNAEIGQIEFIVPTIVIDELTHLSKTKDKRLAAMATLKVIHNFKKIELNGPNADDALVSYVKSHGRGIIATVDGKLKQRIKVAGGSVISLSNDRIVIEPSKI